MERLTQFRAHILILIFCLVVGFFAFRLYDLQIIETEGKTDNTSTFITQTRVKAARGDILDCNGNLLVSNRASYDLVINHYVLLSAKGTSQHLYRLVQRCQQEGITYEEHFPISKERPFTYTLDEYNSAWQGYFQSFLAFRDGLDSDITAPLLIEKLREQYELPAEWTDEEARLVIGLYYELALRQCVPSLSNYVFITDASDENLSDIAELNVPGLNVEASTVREYNTKYAAHILGYVGPMDADQWEYYKDIDGYKMDAEVGQDGLEAVYEEQLHGIDGIREDTVATDGTLISSRYLVEPKAGANVEVTIDINLQMKAEDEMASVLEYLRSEENPSYDGRDAEGAAVVAMEVKTGKILTCASSPTYDLATFSENYNQILEQEYDPLFNRALLAAYPPGSTYKMSMVVAAINSKLIDSKTTIYDKGVFRMEGGFKAYCLAYSSRGGSHQSINAAEALMHSCNYFFYDLGSRISLSAMDSTAKGLGLGEPTGVELPEEIGHRANEETKEKLYTGDAANFYLGNQVLAAIGQDDNRFTPLQLCVYACTLANQGKRYKATFLNRVVSSDYRSLILEGEPSIMSHMEISDEAFQTVMEGMYLVTSNNYGTAATTFMNYPIKVAAKTGTAQTGIPDASDNGAFVCFAPADDPQIAIAIYGEKAGHGSSLAGIARSMLDIYFEVGQIGDVNTYENKLS